MLDQTIELDDKYDLSEDRIFTTGTQALVRLTLMQKRADMAAGLNTAGFVTGYRGSPLGGVDQTFLRARSFTDPQDITLHPAVNEDLAATSVLGTQQINLMERAHRDGVFSMWYGKGPGVDRSGDALRHGNLAGTAPHGGVLVLAGDDHTAKSSTTSHQSEYALVDAMIPVLNPSGVREILEFGLFGWALSRFSGTWAALKLVADTMDSSASIAVPGLRSFATPTDIELPDGGLSIRWPDSPQAMERRLHNHKIPAVGAFARANRIDRVEGATARRRIGIVTTGKSYLDLLQALEILGLPLERAAELGISVYKVGLVWPLEPQGLHAFAEGLEELLVIEEKRPLIESQIKDQLFHMPADRRPRVLGKRDAQGQIVFPLHGDLSSDRIAAVLAQRLLPLIDAPDLGERLRQATDARAALPDVPLWERTPYFCSGCPHNSSTKVPEGSRAFAGIGCHYLAQKMDRNTATYTHMGGEGANWIGQAPYVPTRHVFQNIGDGTYFHSGLLAIRAAVAAKVNITYKILYNDAVAMTGGQTHDGPLDPQRITHQLRAEGVERIAVASDDIAKYRGQKRFAEGVTIHPREELDAVQRELREVEGVTALVYDQVCAAEKRRRSKRAAPTPTLTRRVFINELVCEGCGDCSKKSNCLSVTPMETEFGRKRRIDQSSCNLDHSCVNGFCPSFVTLEGAELRKPLKDALSDILSADLPMPALPALDEPWNIMVTGVGGTGIITIGAILAMAAHTEGKGCSTLDMTGMAQKGGAVTSHIRLCASPDTALAHRIPDAEADLVIGGDPVVTASREALGVVSGSRSRVILNAQQPITSDFIRDPAFHVPTEKLADTVRRHAGGDHVDLVSATRLAERTLGDAIGANLFLVGYAFQKGLIPLSEAAILNAIRLNRVAIEMNETAFRLGRVAAQHPERLSGFLDESPAPGLAHRLPSRTLDETIARRVDFLTGYQNSRYGESYRKTIERVRARETAAMGQEGPLTETVARSLFKLMAYKDEYEVARLYAASSFKAMIDEAFGAQGRMYLHLAPPILARVDPATGEPAKRRFGPWIFTLLRLMSIGKCLRGTRLDPFGHTVERREERQLIEDFRQSIELILATLSPETMETALELAAIPDGIRGFGPVKARSIAAVRPKWAKLEAALKQEAAR
ncbi:indolepyruvate ferredoxin oxidoreductase family protein [Chachezhania sediminis]|uniref:indolepyruvate ferredoxin oxidoreductase family protein n=1 Tax=Chachezhania sediminis TaxID=2599291 RepID=UPI00131C2587|nr:indolepyruvate ferredoxin oxidoreductase family protein [Chachezhania sediminis]